MLYKVKMTSGHTIQLRGVRKFDYDAKAGKFKAVLPGWSSYSGHGVEHISIDEDPEWWGATVSIVDPKTDGESEAPNSDGASCPSGYSGGLVNFDVFRREECVPAELAVTTFAPLEHLLPKFRRRIRRNRTERMSANKEREAVH